MPLAGIKMFDLREFRFLRIEFYSGLFKLLTLHAGVIRYLLKHNGHIVRKEKINSFSATCYIISMRVYWHGDRGEVRMFNA